MTHRPLHRSSLGKSALLCAWLIGCNGCNKSTPHAEAPSPKEEKTPPKDDTAPKTLPTPPGEKVSFDEALSRVQQVRGLKKKAHVDGLRIAASDLEQHLKQTLSFERPPTVLRGTEQMLVGLGLVEPNFDFEATMISLLKENLAGLYEPRLKLMMVREGLPEETRRITLLHELVHALQDQYFDLDEIVTNHPDDSDKSSALSCLAEGDATSAMLDGVLPAGKTALDLPPGSIEAQFFSQPPQTQAPDLIIRSLYAPYLDGLNFVHALRRRGGFAEVNRVFSKPPISTEQVLHLDKYDEQEAPLEVEVPAPPPSSGVEAGAHFKLVLHDVWGEQSLRLALEEWGSPEEARKAAAGWGGDRIVSYQRNSEIAVAWSLVMDTPQDAEELWQLVEKKKAISTGDTALDDAAQGDRAQDRAPLPEVEQTICLAPRGPTGPQLALTRSGARLIWASAPFDPQAQSGGSCAEARGWLSTLLVKNTPASRP